MKEAIVDPNTDVQIINSPIPEPGEHDVLIKVAVSGSNPKDWKHGGWYNVTRNTGDDIAGVVSKVGSKVTTFVPGQRVAALHRLGESYGSFAEYSIAPDWTTFALPHDTSFEDAAAIPLAALTAALGLFARLELPEPWGDDAGDGDRAKKVGPLIVYGAATAVGGYAIQWAKRAGIGPILAVAGKGIPFVESFLDKSEGDAVIDYRNGNEALVDELTVAAKSLPGSPELLFAFDCVSEHGSAANIGKVLSPRGRVTNVLPYSKDSGLPDTIRTSFTGVGSVHGASYGEQTAKQSDFGQAYSALMGKGLQEGWFKAHPVEVVPGGLAGVERGLKDMRAGKNSALKYVFRIADTPGL